MKKILSLMRKCIDDFKMIEDGDRIESIVSYCIEEGVL